MWSGTGLKRGSESHWSRAKVSSERAVQMLFRFKHHHAAVSPETRHDSHYTDTTHLRSTFCYSENMCQHACKRHFYTITETDSYTVIIQFIKLCEFTYSTTLKYISAICVLFIEFGSPYSYRNYITMHLFLMLEVA